MRTWSKDDPKAGLMTRKRAQIVDAALEAFLEQGYAESSVNKIADAAGVSIKTLYRHFDTKDELFNAVMLLACSNQSQQSDTALESNANDAAEPIWYAERPDIGLALAGEEYLRHVLSEQQLAIHRVITRDAHRFPELHQRYRKEITGRRADLFVAYLDRWQTAMGWKIDDKYAAAAVFGGLLKAPFFDDAIQGGRTPTDDAVSHWAKRSAACLSTLLEAGLL